MALLPFISSGCHCHLSLSGQDLPQCSSSPTCGPFPSDNWEVKSQPPHQHQSIQTLSSQPRVVAAKRFPNDVAAERFPNDDLHSS